MKQSWWLCLGLGLVACGSGDDAATPDAEVADAAQGGPDGCVAVEPFAATPTPLDLHVMLDQSGSMGDPVTGGTKWSQIVSALESFAGGSAPRTPALGLQYFGLDDGNGAGTDSCVAADYGVADVEIGAGASALTTSLGLHGPGSTTPMSAALQGAVDHAQTWRIQHEGEQVAVVLITDGVPTDCDTDLSHVAAISAAAAASLTTAVRTSVVAVGTGLGSLDPIATSGAANVVDPAGNVAAQLGDTLLAIRAAASCGYARDGLEDVDAYELQYTPAAGSARAIPKVANLAACSGDGYYVEPTSSPSAFSLCPATCADAIAGGEVGVLPTC